MSTTGADGESAFNASVEVDPDLVWSVRNYYPPPIAEPFVLFDSELNHLVFDTLPPKSPEWRTALEHCVDCYIASVRLTSLLAASVCAQRASTLKTSLPESLVEFAKDLCENERPGHGRWWGLLREALRGLQQGDDFISVLARRYWKQSRGKESPTDLQTGVDLGIAARNALQHKSMDPALCAETTLKLAPILYRWYRALEFFKIHWLVVPVAVKEGVAELELLCGDHRRYVRRSYSSFVPLLPGRVYLMDSSGAATLEENAILPVHPLVIANRKADGGAPDVLVFETRKSKTPEFGAVHRADLDDEFLEAIGPLLPSRGALAEMPRKAQELVKPAAEMLRDKSAAFLKRAEHQRTYQAALHVPRNSLDESVTAFLAGKKQVLILSGPSGMGKTSFLCYFAARNLAVADNSTLVLLVGADSLPPVNISLERVVCEAMECASPLAKWVQDVRTALGSKKMPWRLIVILDAIDKHSAVKELLRAVDHWAEFVARDLPELKLLASYSPGGLDEIPEFTVERYFSPPREILSEDVAGAALPSVLVPPFTREESRKAYEKYREAARLTTPYDDLQEPAKAALAQPLFMRLVSEAYKNGAVPPNPISFQTLQKYCEPYIFSDRTRRAFVEHLVDTMLNQNLREISGRQMTSDPELREAYLSKHSPFQELLDDQVLSVHRRPSALFPASIDEEYVSFSMERVFQFLLILRAIERHRGSVAHFLESGLPETIRTAREYPSLRSGLVDLLAEVARNPSLHGAEKRLVFSQLCTASDGGSDQWILNLLSEVLLVLADEEVDPEDLPAEGAGPLPSPFQTIADLILEQLGDHATAMLSATVTALFVRAQWVPAFVLLRRQAESSGLGDLLRFRVRNQLVVVLKNKDDWEEAQKYSDDNDTFLDRIEDQSLKSRHWLNRFSVYYDLGRRKYARDLCDRANQIARAHSLPLEEAATANNLGIADVYFDRPAVAERYLTEGIAAAGENGIMAAHNYLNRGLVRMVRWQLRGGGPALYDAEKDVKRAAGQFAEAGKIQGILYCHATRGLIWMYYGEARKRYFAAKPQEEWAGSRDYEACIEHFREARKLMERGLEMARQKEEDWPNYGIQADLALWHLKHPHPNLDEALAFAEGAYNLIQENGGYGKDPEGTSVISMVLARVLLNRKETPERIENLLKQAFKTFLGLRFYSAATRAAAGLIEVAALTGAPAERHRRRRDRIRSRLDPAEFPANFGETFEPMDWKLLFLAELF